MLFLYSGMFGPSRIILQTNNDFKPCRHTTPAIASMGLAWSQAILGKRFLVDELLKSGLCVFLFPRLILFSGFRCLGSNVWQRSNRNGKSLNTDQHNCQQCLKPFTGCWSSCTGARSSCEGDFQRRGNQKVKYDRVWYKFMMENEQIALICKCIFFGSSGNFRRFYANFRHFFHRFKALSS